MGVELPIGARIYGWEIHHDALGASVTLALGDVADVDRYLVAAAANAAGQLTQGADGAIGGVGYKLTGTNDRDITITTGGAAATGSIILIVLYAID